MNEPSPIDQETVTEGAPLASDSVADSYADSEQWSEFAPSLPSLLSHSQHVVAAVSKIGESVGEFEIIRLLGEGAFGKVFLARQTSLDREVAVKITADLGLEGRTMARLEHAHVVQVYSETVDETLGIRLLCMQYVPGATMHKLIGRIRDLPRDARNGQAMLRILDQLSIHSAVLDPVKLRYREVLSRCQLDEAVCWIGWFLAEALSYAHHRKVLHLDIKPANVMMNQYGQPMLTDFSHSMPTTGAARVGAAVFGGTIGYMAPEHIRALNPSHPSGPELVDPRSDIYSLGAVLLEMLVDSSRKPGMDRSLDGRDIDWVIAHQRDIGQVCRQLDESQVSAPLTKIIRRCLDPDPERRFQTAGELAAALNGGFALLRIERRFPPAGRWTRWALARPFGFLLFFTLVPNFSASAINLVYNILVVIKDLSAAQQNAFIWMVIWYNVVVIAIMIAMLNPTLLAAYRSWRRVQRDTFADADDVDRARRLTQRLPMASIVLGCVGWLPFAVVIPLGMHVMAGPIPRGVILQISVAFAMTGVIAIITHYYVVSYVAIRVLYTRLLCDYQNLHEIAFKELSRIPNRNRFFQVLSGLMPLCAATVLLLIGPDQFTPESFGRFRITLLVLIALGIAGFALATTATARLADIIAVMTTGHDVREAC